MFHVMPKGIMELVVDLLAVEQDALMSPNPSVKLEDLAYVVCVCLVV